MKVDINDIKGEVGYMIIGYKWNEKRIIILKGLNNGTNRHPTEKRQYTILNR